MLFTRFAEPLHVLRWALPLVLLGAGRFAAPQALITTSGFNNCTTETMMGSTATVISGQGVQIGLPTPNASFRMYPPITTSWAGYSHLQFTVQNQGASMQPIFVGLDTGAGTGWCWTEFQLAPGSMKVVLLPLDTEGTMGLWGLPQPATNSGAQIITWGTFFRNDVRRVLIMTQHQTSPVTLLVQDLRPVATPSPTSAFVDTYGQQTINYAGKIKSNNDLSRAGRSESTTGQYPFTADAYGGVAGTAQQGLANGYWQVAKQNSRWHIITPLGNRFFSAGICSAANSSNAIIADRMSYFQSGALPSPTGQYAASYATAVNPRTGLPEQVFNFYTCNLQRKYGSQWTTKSLDVDLARMKNWGFNTAGPSSNTTFQSGARALPFTETVGIAGAFVTVHDYYGSPADLPDVFDPAWAAAVRSSLAPMTQKFQGNSYNLGLFIDNEQAWAKPWTALSQRYGLMQDILMAPANQPAKVQFVSWLQQRYSGISALNTSWGSGYASFSAILTTQNFAPDNMTSGMATDFQGFALIFARQYFSTIKNTLQALNYHGLYLGCRLLYYCPEALQAASENCSVISFSAYDFVPSMYRADMKAIDAPVLISEIGFGASDLGRINGCLNQLSEADRITLYNQYIADAQTWPNLVGYHWYKWEDDPPSGRVWDSYNSASGLVTITDTAYSSFAAAVTQANTAFHQALLGG